MQMMCSSETPIDLRTTRGYIPEGSQSQIILNELKYIFGGSFEMKNSHLYPQTP
jgi:hypothetical protein